MKKFLVLSTMFLCFAFSSETVKAADIILGKVKYLGTLPNGDQAYRCKNRAMICVVSSDNGDGTKEAAIHFDTGVVVTTVQDVIISPSYVDAEGNEITDVTIKPI